MIVRKRFVLLAIGALVSGATAVLVGCGTSAPAVQPAATPAETESPLLQRAVPAETVSALLQPADAPTETKPPPLKLTATEFPPMAGNAVSKPDPVSSGSDGLELVSVDSSRTFERQEPIEEIDPDYSKKGDPGAANPVQGDPYNWQDGDRIVTVKLQADLVVERDSAGLPRDVVQADEGETNIVRSAVEQSKGNTLPVFRSESGGLMTLPGGVLLVLSSEWSQAETKAFFSDNGINMDRLSELGYVANGYFIETDPGFPSLDLANALAGQEGVEISSPNWGREATPK